MPYLHEFLAVALIHLLAVMSPGPDFAMVMRNSLAYSRRAGLWASAGLALGILVHVTYSLIGIGLLIAQSIVLFNIIKIAGAVYLVYIGWQSLRAKPVAEAADVESRPDPTRLQALRTGFLTNVLNPKATLLFLSIFTQVIDRATPAWVQALYGLEMAGMTFVWFAFVAATLSAAPIRRRFVRVQHHVERMFGVLLIALGVKVAFSAR